MQRAPGRPRYSFTQRERRAAHARRRAEPAREPGDEARSCPRRAGPSSTSTSPRPSAGASASPSRSVARRTSLGRRPVRGAASASPRAAQSAAGVSVTSGRIISSTEMPPCWNESAVLALELVEARRVDEVVVLARQHVVLVHAVVGQHVVHRLAHDDRLLGVAVQVDPELVAQVGRGVAVAVDQRRAPAQHRAVVGGQHHGARPASTSARKMS